MPASLDDFNQIIESQNHWPTNLYHIIISSNQVWTKWTMRNQKFSNIKLYSNLFFICCQFFAVHLHWSSVGSDPIQLSSILLSSFFFSFSVRLFISYSDYNNPHIVSFYFSFVVSAGCRTALGWQWNDDVDDDVVFSDSNSYDWMCVMLLKDEKSIGETRVRIISKAQHKSDRVVCHWIKIQFSYFSFIHPTTKLSTVTIQQKFIPTTVVLDQTLDIRKTNLHIDLIHTTNMKRKTYNFWEWEKEIFIWHVFGLTLRCAAAPQLSLGWDMVPAKCGWKQVWGQSA